MRFHSVSEGMFTYTVNPNGANVMFDNTYAVFEKYQKDLERAYVIINGESIPVRASYCGIYDVSHGAMPENDGEIIAGEELRRQGIRIGDTVTICGNIYIVCALRANDEYNEILYSSLASNAEISEIKLTFKNKLSRQKSIDLIKDLKEKFPNSEIILPDNQTHYNAEPYLFRSAAIAFSMAFFNLMFVIYYLLQKRKQTINIMRLCGATKRKIYKDVILEIFLYGFCGTIPGNIIFFTFLSKGYITSYAVNTVDIILSHITAPVLMILSAIAALTKVLSEIEKEVAVYYE